MSRTRRRPELGTPLTATEVSILRLIAAGNPSVAIARQLGRSEGAVKSALVRTYCKLGAHDRAHAVALAYEQALLVGGDSGGPRQAVDPCPG